MVGVSGRRGDVVGVGGRGLGILGGCGQVGERMRLRKIGLWIGGLTMEWVVQWCDFEFGLRENFVKVMKIMSPIAH